MSIKVSVVIATYKRPDLLLKCLRALVMQRFNRDEYEVVVVSDGPDEITVGKLNKWLKGKLHHVRYLTMSEKKGPAAARNYGWLHARGQLIAFTDDDCIPDKHWIASFYNRYTAGQDIAFTGRTIVPISKYPTDYERNTAGLQTADFITANCCTTKTALEKTGGFDEQFTMAWREDSDLEFKLIKENIPIVRIDEAIVVHPVRQAPWGISIKEQKKTMFNALLYKKYPELYKQKIRQVSPVMYYGIISGFLVMLGGVLLKSGIMLIVGGFLWKTLTGAFIVKRIRKTRFTFTHVSEMVVTSVIIPFLSVFWQFYGAIKYRVLFI
jgi:glycosyltransferase involved in cell wall biosynthesis